MSIEAQAPAKPETARRISLSLVMPGLNEEAGIERAVRRSIEALDRLTDEFEVIVIDDGSTDRTGEIVDRIAAEDPRVRVLHNERNLNYGISLARGIRAARCDWILHNGVDLPLAPEDLGRFTPLFGEADVIAVRRIDRSAHSPWRQLTSWVNNLLLRVLFRPRTVDLNFVQFYRRSAVQSLPLVSTSPASVTPELILRAERKGLRVHEVSAEFHRREVGTVHFGKPHDILWTLNDMLALRLRTWLRGWDA